jgi:hypothetical protein
MPNLKYIKVVKLLCRVNNLELFYCKILNYLFKKKIYIYTYIYMKNMKKNKALFLFYL